MIIGLQKIPSNAHVFGAPFIMEAFGLSKLDETTSSVLYEGEVVSPEPAIEPNAVKVMIWNMGTLELLGTFNGDVPEFQVSLDSNVRIPELLVIPNDEVALANLSESEFFTVPEIAIPTSNVRINWTQNNEPDFHSYELCWDNGIAALAVSDFFELASIRDKRQTYYQLRDLATGTYRFYMRVKDRYGNIGPAFGSITPVSITVTAPPSLAGAFVFDSSSETVKVSFNVTASSGVADVAIFINYAYGYGLLDTINYNHSYTKATLPRALPLGRIQLAAVGFTKYGFPTVPITTTCIVVNDGTQDVLFDDFETPINITTETIAAGLFKLYYENINPGWTSLDYEIVESDLTPVTTGNTSSASGVQIDPNIADGSYLLRMRAKYVGASTIYGEWSEYVDLLIDSTAPTGNAITVEKIL
jgi:hypothetical protein